MRHFVLVVNNLYIPVSGSLLSLSKLCICPPCISISFCIWFLEVLDLLGTDYIGLVLFHACHACNFIFRHQRVVFMYRVGQSLSRCLQDLLLCFGFGSVFDQVFMSLSFSALSSSSASSACMGGVVTLNYVFVFLLLSAF